MLAQNDAAVLIGDAALKFMEQHELPECGKAERVPEDMARNRWRYSTWLNAGSF